MPDGRFAILDPAAGISGDMLLGALIAAGAPPEWLRALPGRLGFPEVTVAIAPVDRCGIRAVKVDVILPGGHRELPSEPVAAPHPHAHEHGAGAAPEHGSPGPEHPSEHAAGHAHAHPPGHSHEQPQSHGHSHPHGDGAHRHVGELIRLIERADLSAWVRERAVQAFRLLGEAEGRVHGLPADEVPLHEVGAIDALVDIVGAIEGFERLGIHRIYHRAVAAGSGWVRAAHGVIPVPAPATALLLEGLEVRSDGPVVGEATTPTGAVLLHVLSAGAPPASWRMVHAGAWGAGGRNPVSYPNALRLIVAEPAAEAGEVVQLSTDVDDLSPEYLEPLREALFAAGALDVQVWATQMKKGRAGFRIEATAAPAGADRVVEALFRHSTTAGVRRHRAERVTLARREIQVEAAEGVPVRVKVLDGPDGPRVKPEYDDLVAAARRLGRPAHELARDLQIRALRSVAAERAAQPGIPTKESE